MLTERVSLRMQGVATDFGRVSNVPFVVYWFLWFLEVICLFIVFGLTQSKSMYPPPWLMSGGSGRVFNLVELGGLNENRLSPPSSPKRFPLTKIGG